MALLLVAGVIRRPRLDLNMLVDHYRNQATADREYAASLRRSVCAEHTPVLA
jgi:hypothetical protein